MVNAWAHAIERALGSPQVQFTMRTAGVAVKWLDPQAHAAHWKEAENTVRQFLLDSGAKVREA